MTTQRVADALRNVLAVSDRKTDIYDEAHAALAEAALTAQQGEVVAWRFKLDDGSFQYGTAGHEVRIPRPIVEATPLYTAPPAPEPAAQGEAVAEVDWPSEPGNQSHFAPTVKWLDPHTVKHGDKLYTDPPAQPAAQGETQRSSHRVFRREDWLPCYCAAQADHPIGAEKAAQPAERVPEHSIREAIHAMRRCKAMSNHPDWDVHITNIEKLLTASPAPAEGGKGVEG